MKNVLQTANGGFNIRQSVTQLVLQSLVVTSVLSHLNYGSTVLCDLP